MMLSMKRIFQLVGFACAAVGMSHSLFAATGTITFKNEDCGTLSIILFEGDQAATDSIGKHTSGKGKFIGPFGLIPVIKTGEEKSIAIDYDSSKMITAIFYEGEKTGFAYEASYSARGIGGNVKSGSSCTSPACSGAPEQGKYCCKSGKRYYNNLGYKHTLSVQAGQSYVLSQANGTCGTRGPAPTPPPVTPPPAPTPTPTSCGVPAPYDTGYAVLNTSLSGVSESNTHIFKNCTSYDKFFIMLVNEADKKRTQAKLLRADGDNVTFHKDDVAQMTHAVLFECQQGQGSVYAPVLLNDADGNDAKYELSALVSAHQRLKIITGNDSDGFSVTGVSQDGYDNCAPVVLPPPPPVVPPVVPPVGSPTSCGMPGTAHFAGKDYASYAEYKDTELEEYPVVSNPNKGDDKYRWIKNCTTGSNLQIMLVNESAQKRLPRVILNSTDVQIYHRNDYNKATHILMWQCKKNQNGIWEAEALARRELSKMNNSGKKHKVIYIDKNTGKHEIRGVEADNTYNKCNIDAAQNTP